VVAAPTMSTAGQPANLPPSVLATPSAELLRRLELAITRRLDGILQGDYRGLVPGHGSELGESRLYQPGDDVRRMDWNVTARQQTPHVRDSIADRELETWAMIDLSASLGFGTATCLKRDLAVAALAAVGFLTSRAGNRIGAVTLEGERLATVPARTGRNHLLALLQRVVTSAQDEHAGPADLAGGVRRLSATMRRRGLAVVISDFLDDGSWDTALRALSVRHEVLAVEVVDPRELELPDVGVVELEDPETGERIEVQTSSGAMRSKFADAAAAQRDDIARRIRAAGADHLVLRTDRDWLLELVRFVAWRRERLDALSRVRP
jgi:uncharacterized protein (DUF58 family)